MNFIRLIGVVLFFRCNFMSLYEYLEFVNVGLVKDLFCLIKHIN